MEYWLTWLIVAAIGLVVGFIVHAMIRFAQGGSMLIPLLAGIAGALIGAFFLEPYFALPTVSRLVERFIWAFLGALVLSLVVEFFFAGSRRGRVVAV